MKVIRYGNQPVIGPLDSRTLGELLRRVRIDRGLTLGQVARALGFSVVAVSAAEHNNPHAEAVPVAEHLAAIGASKDHVELARRLGCNV